jgi:hypothetical protein
MGVGDKKQGLFTIRAVTERATGPGWRIDVIRQDFEVSVFTKNILL